MSAPTRRIASGPSDGDWIDALAGDASLRVRAALRARTDALDRIERFLAFGEPSHEPAATAASIAQRRARAEAVRDAFEAIDTALYRALREAIRAGRGREALRAWAPASDPDRDDLRAGERYDHLDALLAGVFAFDAPDAEVAALPPEMVAYQPTPARAIFDLVERAGIIADDVLIDLGSGLGQVPLLVHLCTGAQCIGIEREDAYVRSARRCAEDLALTGVTFHAQDARAADLSAATVVYLYTPFTGGVLRAVLDRLRAEAARRPLRICTYGPCTARIAQEPWLDAPAAIGPDRVAVFRTRAVDV